MSNHKDLDDPYSQIDEDQMETTLQVAESESKAQRKMKRLKKKFNEAKSQAKMGGMMGFKIGVAFGSIIGIWQAITTRSLIVIPVSMVGSGFTFMMIMGIGGLIRSDPLKFNDINQLGIKIQAIKEDNTLKVQQNLFWVYKMDHQLV